MASIVFKARWEWKIVSQILIIYSQLTDCSGKLRAHIRQNLRGTKSLQHSKNLSYQCGQLLEMKSVYISLWISKCLVFLHSLLKCKCPLWVNTFSPYQLKIPGLLTNELGAYSHLKVQKQETGYQWQEEKYWELGSWGYHKWTCRRAAFGLGLILTSERTIWVDEYIGVWEFFHNCPEWH